MWLKGLSRSLGQRIFWELMCILKLSPSVSWSESSEFLVTQLSRIQTLLNKCMEASSVVYTTSWKEVFMGIIRMDTSSLIFSPLLLLSFFLFPPSLLSYLGNPIPSFFSFIPFLQFHHFHLGWHFPGEGLLLYIPLPFTVLNNNNAEGFSRYTLKLVA